MYDDEFLQIVKKIISNSEYIKLKDVKHHFNSNRYKHMLEVSYITYKFCKKRNLDYISATRAAILHDFYFDDDFIKNKDKLLKHYKISIRNSEKICNLNDMEKNIIASHMFPIGGKIPKYKESIVVDIIDDLVSIKERFGGSFKKLKYAINIGICLLFAMIK